MKVTYIHSTDPVDKMRVHLRCRNFSDAINRVGFHSASLLDLESFIRKSTEAEDVCASSDLLVIHRHLGEPAFQAIQYWKARDKKVVVDFDHSVEELSSNGLEQFKWGLGMVDAAIVSSAQLVADWSSYADVHEIHDYLNTDQYPGFKHSHENEIWIGLPYTTGKAEIHCGGLSGALEKVCEERPNVRFVYCDSRDAGLEFQNICETQLVSYPPSSFEEWSDVLLKLDIGLLPVCDGRDLQRGRIGLLEFMVSKIPWLATDHPGLRELSRYGCLVSNTPDGWETAILKAVDDIETLQKWAAGEPFLFALSQDVNGNIDKVLKLFTYILNQSKRTGAA